jgi:hypothetical protein
VDAEQELSLVPLVDPTLRARLRSLLGTERGRRKFLRTLYHRPPFDRRYVVELRHEQQGLDAVQAQLMARRAPAACYVISTHAECDGTTMPLVDALHETCNGNDGTILLCIPAQLAYYHGEGWIGGGFQLIVERRGRATS